MYGHAVETVTAEEGAAYGAALLAGVGAGYWKSVDEACDAVVKTSSTTPPDAEAMATMNRRYDQYRRVYPALKSIYDRDAIELRQEPCCSSVSPTRASLSN